MSAAPSRPPASLSLDLDNRWSYLKTHGDPGWEAYPTYLDIVVPRVLEILAARGLTITFFVVGQDAVRPENREALGAIAEAGHEIGNHSFRHEPWFHLYDAAEIDDELARTEDAIESFAGRRPIGFRGPGFSLSENTLRVLHRRGYRYDASTLPTWLGPAARAWYFLTARLDDDQKRERARLFGTPSEALRPVKPYLWTLDAPGGGAGGGGELLEIPVTTIPWLKVPFHASYGLWLGRFSPFVASRYHDLARGLCRLTGTAPSFLLHPLDFLGADDVADLAFFPAMNLPGALKAERTAAMIDALAADWELGSMRRHAEALEAAGSLPRRAPRFPTAPTRSPAGAAGSAHPS